MKKIVLAVFMAAMALSLSAQINFREGGFAEALEAANPKTNWCLWIVTPVVRSLQIDGV